MFTASFTESRHVQGLISPLKTLNSNVRYERVRYFSAARSSILSRVVGS